RHIPDRIDALIGRAQALVDDDAVRLVADAGGVEIELFDIRPAPRGDEKVAAFDGLGARGRHNVDRDARQRAAHARDLDATTQLDALAVERIEHDGRAFGIIARK